MEIKETTFGGLRAVELTTSALQLTAVVEFGPRIAFFGKPEGSNLLLWEPEKYSRGDWNLRGGHRVWATRPGADENEDTYATDNEPCEATIEDGAVCIMGAENAVNKTRRGLRITCLDEDRLSVENILVNTGDMLYSGGVWALTCTLPTKGTQYAVPIGDGSSWDAFNMVFFREWGGHGQGGFSDQQIRITDDLVLLTPQGVENKRMLLAHHGIIAMSDPVNDVTFAKKVDYDPAGAYPLNTNIAFYIGPDNFMVEMETMGPETTLKPGASVRHVETWTLKQGALPMTDAEQVKALF